jgi:hypothetical protein
LCLLPLEVVDSCIEFVLRLCTAGRAGVYCVRGKLLEKAA